MKSREDVERFDSLHPTLWRTCRVLANRRRLMCLKVIIESPGMCVTAIAEDAGITVSKASSELRALQARGLVEARRESRWVHYFPIPDPLVPMAQPILKAVSSALRAEESPESIMRQITAFTHPRRLRIIHSLQIESPMDIELLSRYCGISLVAAFRHLEKLADRGVVRCVGEKVSLRRPSTRIHRAIYKLIAQDPAPHQKSIANE